MPVVALLCLLAAAPAGEKMGVFNLNVVGLEPAVAQTAMDAMATAAAALPGRQLITRNELDAMLGAERLKDMVGCDSASCFAEIGAAAGVRWVITGSLSKVEGALLASLQLVDTQSATAAKRVTLSWPGSTGAVAELLGLAVEKLLLGDAEQKPGVITLTGVPTHAVVLLDGTRGEGTTSALTHVAAGIHTLRVEADGFEPYEAPLLVRNGAVTAASVALVERVGPPFYSRWWFWTGVAALAAGGTAAAITFAGGGGGTDDGTDSQLPGDPTGGGTYTINVPAVFQLGGGQ